MPPATWEFDPPAGIVATVSGWGTTSVRISLKINLNTVCGFLIIKLTY
jgi:hypothetical protein